MVELRISLVIRFISYRILSFFKINNYLKSQTSEWHKNRTFVSFNRKHRSSERKRKKNISYTSQCFSYLKIKPHVQKEQQKRENTVSRVGVSMTIYKDTGRNEGGVPRLPVSLPFFSCLYFLSPCFV